MWIGGFDWAAIVDNLTCFLCINHVVATRRLRRIEFRDSFVNGMETVGTHVAISGETELKSSDRDRVSHLSLDIGGHRFFNCWIPSYAIAIEKLLLLFDFWLRLPFSHFQLWFTIWKCP